MATTEPTETKTTCAAEREFKKGLTLASAYRLEQKLTGDFIFARWLAHDEQTDQKVVLNFLPDAVVADGGAMTELRQEAKRNRQLVHPHVVRVHDLIEEEKWAAIVTDRVEGDTLAGLLAARPGRAFEPGEIHKWTQQLCRTLEDAHRIGLLHRDLCPANLIIGKSGDLLAANFGVSRTILDSLSRARIPVPPGRDLAYASPQQLDGERPARTDDIYAIGATLYELLSGKPPF